MLPDAALPASTCNTTGANAGYISGAATSPSSVDQQACELARQRIPSLGGTYAAGAATYSTQLVNLLSDVEQFHAPATKN